MAIIKLERAFVTGGRKFNDSERIENDLRDLMFRGCTRVAEGRCHKGGADLLARQAWQRLTGNDTVGYPVERAKDGPWPAAGNRRNARMLREEMQFGRVDIGLAYPDPDSRGTWACIAEALCLCLPIMLWSPEMGPADIIANVRGRWRGASFLMTDPGNAEHRGHRLLVSTGGDYERARENLANLIDTLTWWPVGDLPPDTDAFRTIACH